MSTAFTIIQLTWAARDAIRRDEWAAARDYFLKAAAECEREVR